jgi:hypothetical protein
VLFVELRDYIRILRKNWILIVACALLGVAAASAVSIAATAKYVSSTELYVSVRSGSESATAELVQGTSFARQAVTSYVSIVNSARVLTPVIDELGLDMGRPVKILDVGQRMIEMSDKQIEIVYTGLRPGEKLHEELIGAGESDERLVHPKISHAQVDHLAPENLDFDHWLRRCQEESPDVTQLLDVRGGVA